MRRNRRRYAKISTVNHKVVTLFSLLALVVTLGALAGLALRSSISKTAREIGKLEKEAKSLRTERTRAETKWSACVKPERLDEALSRHGLHMDLASGEKIVSLRGRQPPSQVDLSGSTRVAANEKATRIR